MRGGKYRRVVTVARDEHHTGWRERDSEPQALPRNATAARKHCGVNDLTANQGWVSLGIDHDTAEFAVQSILRWWLEKGVPFYKKATWLLITADCGGSNGYRVRLWRMQLQHLADELGLAVQVCHFPPGTSKWNMIEHRMFCHITNNWRGRPLLTRQVVVNLIGSVSTAQGLPVKVALDENTYEARNRGQRRRTGGRAH